MFSRRDRVVVDLALAVFVFVGVSGAISLWFREIYSEIASWAMIALGLIAALVGVLRWLDFDPVLDGEIRKSWKENGATVRALDGGQPELARLLAREATDRRQPAPPKGL